ncbi:hypothetical protein GEV33_000052 [Tenebrio molitor]|uniref:Uncharacterized protein n=1 Tax=Tenebrio molitor TaxID=7067 RepID=A0A8J6HXW4_TENMO|nr:hypothetical protein GEV33_000052 [Tenebrio molitor]
MKLGDNTFHQCMVDFDLKKLLAKTVTGQAIMASYNDRGLSPKCQGYLTNIVICNFFDIDIKLVLIITVRLTNDILSQVANAIVELFPKECKEVYFSAPVPKRYSKTNTAGIARENAKCYPKRIPLKTIKEEVEMNLMLIESDFEELYKDKVCMLFEHWPSTFESVLEVSKNKKPTNGILFELLNGGKLKKDSEDVIKFLVLFETVSNNASKVVKKGGKTYWKPTVAESQEGFILHVKAPSNIHDAIEAKRTKMASFGMTVQPYIIIVGPTFYDIQTVHLYIHDILYTVPTLLKAVDVCFKSFIVFDLQYPLEAEHIWFLIQWIIYDIHLKSDKKLPQIFQLHNQIKNQKSV